MASTFGFTPVEHQVVVWDPEDEYWEGGVVDNAQGERLKARGVAVLPVLPELFKLSGVGGYSKRSWGAGLALDALAPQMVAPLSLYYTPQQRGLVWSARLVPDAMRPVARPTGRIRFAADSGQRTPHTASYQEKSEAELRPEKFGEPDAYGGWTVGGHGLVSGGSEGHYGFSLYATAPGLRVVWVAATMVPVRSM
jgi:hypothetical protein